MHCPGARSGEAVIEISLTNENDEFYAGHKIDGRVLFPATGYLFLVWKTFAKLRGTNFDQLPVVFENVSFQRATIMQKEGTVKFLINIFEGTGEFEILESNSVAVAGIIRQPTEDSDSEMLRVKPREIPQTHMYNPLNKRDTYKELRLRGYDYQGIFQGIASIDNEGKWARLDWVNNWVSFLDTMLQFSILSNNRGLYLPTRMQKVTLNPKQFLESVTEAGEGAIDVYNYRNLNVVKCNGIELRGLKASLAPRRQGAQSSPKLEEYSFTPYFDDSKVPSKVPMEKVVRFCVDVAMENTPTMKLKVSEVLTRASNTFASLAYDVVLGKPLAYCDATISISKSEAGQLKDLNSAIKVAAKEPSKLFPEPDSNFTIIDDESNISTAATVLKDQSFLLYHSPLLLNSIPEGFTLVAHKMSSHNHFYLLKKQEKPQELKNFVVITVDHSNYQWVEDLKGAMKVASEIEDAPCIILISLTAPDSGILGLVNCLKQEPGGKKVRCYFVKSDLTLNFNNPDFKLKNVISRDVVMNVYEDGVWGSYRHYPLKGDDDTEALLNVEHAYINTLMRGDLSSLRWIEGPLKYFKESKKRPTEELCIFLKNVTFHGILLDALFDKDSDEKRRVVQLVADGIQYGCVKPLPSSVFSDEQIEEAFRFMASGKHIGKVVLKIRDEGAVSGKKVVKAIPRTYFDSDKAYVVVGGLGGFGLELSNWMIERGVTKLSLVSRSGITSGYQDFWVRKWRDQGITVLTPIADVTTLKGAGELLDTTIETLGPIGGLFNLAMVLRDAFIENQTIENFKAVGNPKINATINLDKISRQLAPELDYFVTFSSVSCGRGNAGQSNYGWANSHMERICEARQQDGLPGLAIQWGAIGDVGVVQDHMGGNESVVGGTLPQRIHSCLNALDTFLQQPKPVVASLVLADKTGGNKDAGGKKGNLPESVARILGMKDISNVNQQASLAELGMDSLMGVEVKQLMERDQDLVLSMNEIRQLTIAKLKDIECGENKQENVEIGRTDSVETTDKLDSSKQIRIFVQELMPKEPIVQMDSHGDGHTSLFLVHPIEGVVQSLKTLSSEIGAKVYGLQCVKEAPLESVEDLAQYYIQLIKTIQPQGPYDIAGYSFGCTISLEMALQLECSGELVRNLIFLDGSHKYVSIMTGEYKKKRNIADSDLASENEADALCTFLMQFMSFEYLKLRNELMRVPTTESRLVETAKLLKAAVPELSLEDIKDAALSFYQKLVAADKYKPNSKFKGKPMLIKAIDNKAAQPLGYDYSLEGVCQDTVDIHEVAGNHRSFIEHPSVIQIAQLINKRLYP
ncbi:unnamed protein product [Allacma fusca]|uniref:Fatty acid synthase n=1 Tax=Allacma fusca TaxID=39272 RepID=A0A8J2L151_9HEXA|nr:unnamed protein product [Allacma fusca]